MKPARGFAQIIAVAVIALLIGAVAMFGYQKYLKKPPVVDQKNETQASPLGSADETANWKTYEDNTFGFSIKYPGDILEPHTGELWTKKGVILSNYGSESKSVLIYIGPSLLKEREAFDFFRNAKDGKITKLPEIFKNGNFNGDKTPTKTNLTIAGFPSIKLKVDARGAGLDAMSHYDTYVYIDHNGTLWEITAQFLQAGYRNDFMKTFDQILSTFKFISDETANPDSVGANLKTLKSSKFYIEFKYPPDWQYIQNAKSSQVKLDPYVRIYETSNELVTDGKGCTLYIASIGGSSGPTSYMKESKINIDNKAFTLRSWSKTEGGSGIFNYYFSDTFKSKVDPLIIWSWTPDSNCQAKIGQILSTFKFTQ